MAPLPKKRSLVVAGAAFGLALGGMSLSGAGSALVARVSPPAPPAAAAAEIGTVAAPPASAAPAPVLSLDETRARWFDQVYGGRTFPVSEGLARHPEP